MYHVDFAVSVLNVNVIVTGATKRQHLNTQIIELIYNLGIGGIVYKYA